MPVLLKDGTTVEDPRLDRIYQLDFRSLEYLITHKLADLLKPEDAGLITYAPTSKRWDIGGPLDQGQDGACVGFSSAHKLLSSPTPETQDLGMPVDYTFAKEKIYWEAQKLDEWPGGEYPGATPVYQGTSVLAAAKALKNEGIIDAYHWAVDLSQLALGVMYDGPCVFACNWYKNMFTPDPQGFVTPGGGVAGGHAILIYGVEVVPEDSRRELTWNNIDWRRSYFEIENSWGTDWGLDGRFRMHGNVVDGLLRDQGEACFFHKETVPAPTPPQPQPPTPPTPTPPAVSGINVQVDQTNKQIVLVVTNDLPTATLRLDGAGAQQLITDVTAALGQIGETTNG